MPTGPVGGWGESGVQAKGPLEAEESKNSKPLSHHSKSIIGKHKWHLPSNQSQILNKL